MRFLPVALVICALVHIGGDARAQCSPGPTADPGPALVSCVSPSGTSDVVLDGSRSRPSSTLAPIAQYCWTTSEGTFVESGTATHCASVTFATLRLANASGRRRATVTLTVTDFTGCSDSADLDVFVESTPVLFEARTALPAACRLLPVDLVSRAADTFASSALLTTTWDFDILRDSNGDGQAANDADAVLVGVSGATTVATFTPQFGGDAIARVSVVGTRSACAATADVPYTVTEPPPIGSVSGTLESCAGALAEYRAELAPLSQPATFTWDFDIATDANGDGLPANDVQATGPIVTWRHALGGQRTVRATATDAVGCQSFGNFTTTVNAPPAVSFTTSGPPCSVLAITFRDASAGTPPLSTSWSFGDGTDPVSGSVRTHVYARPGTYRVVQTVIDGRGCSSQLASNVVVSDSALSIAGVRVLDGQPGTGTTGNRDGFADPGERVQIAVDVRNAAVTTATDVTATLAFVSGSPGAVITRGVTDIASILPGSVASSISPHLELSIDETAACGDNLPVLISLAGDASGDCSSSSIVNLRIGAPQLLTLGPEVAVSQVAGVTGEVAMAFGASEHVMVFADASSVSFVRQSVTGSLAGPPQRLVLRAGVLSEPRIAWSPERERFGVTWLETIAGQTQLYFQLVDVSGATTGPARRIDLLGRVSAADVAWTGSSWGLVYVDGTLDSPLQAHAQLLAPEGLPLGAPLQLGSGVAHVRAAGSSFSWAVTLVEPDFGEGVIVTLPPRFPLQVVSRQSFGLVADEPAALLSFAGGWLVAYSFNNQVYVSRLVSDEWGATTTAGPGTRPALAAGATFAAVAWETGSVGVVARGIAPNGEIFGTQAVASTGSSTAEAPAISAAPGDFFATAWGDHRIDNGQRLAIYSRILQPAAGSDCLFFVLGDIAPLPAGDGRVDVSDVVVALRMSVGLIAVTDESLARGDVAPGIRVGSVHHVIGDGVIDIGDVVNILQASTGLITFEP